MREEQRGLDRRGATAVFVAVALAALLGMVALAVDVGMLMKVRADAQRAADSGALAGAHEFLRGVPAAMKNSAALNALEYASRNYVGWKYVDTSGAIFTDSGNNRIANSPEAYRRRSSPDLPYPCRCLGRCCGSRPGRCNRRRC